MKPLLLVLILFCGMSQAAPLPLMNGNFESAKGHVNAQTDGQIEGWKLSGGQGRAATENKSSFAALMGNGDDSNFWRSEALSWQPTRFIA